MVLIFGASTSLGRPENTSRFIVPVLRWLFPSASAESIEKMHYLVRKTAHFTEYAVLGLLIGRLVHFDPVFSLVRSRECVFALLLCALYAASDEFHQKFVPGREPAIRDVCIDTCGAGTGVLVMCFCRRRPG